MPKNKQCADEFTTWLHGQLKELNTDPDVFGTYIIGILDGQETLDEKHEALNDILSEIIPDDLDTLLSVIFEKWNATHPKEEVKKSVHIDVNEQLAKLLEAQKIQTIVKEREYTEEERRIREQILAQYSQTEVNDDDAYDSEEESERTNAAAVAASSSNIIERNTNVQDVMALQKEKREMARLESAAKKQKDKEDRERQRQQREEKKEKRKTVKGERRR
ncbi:coiled-coil domain-containing protein 43 [Anastrepha ludens]|uniref:coiled-coil domain-containing protein 43 n=1 Tax=Anastrepha ludens TaxID=28586 RepID=UPI0023AF66C0|nr:coiled-coil domain-containing protein 43 [Anastrepha ludens]XP_053948880.1 coiled-coil domain-containing protein 43 [Anastrepha ludens]